MTGFEGIKTLLDLGVAGLLLYFLNVIYKDKKEEREYSKKLNTELKDAYVENTKVIQKNTEMSNRALTISEKVLEELNRTKQK